MTVHMKQYRRSRKRLTGEDSLDSSTKGLNKNGPNKLVNSLNS